MFEIEKTIACVILYISSIASHPHYEFSNNPYSHGYGLFSYSNQVPYNTYVPRFPEPDLSFYLSHQQPLNLIAEIPQVIGSTFSVVPMFAVPKDNVNMVSSANILGVSQKQPTVMIKTESNSLLQCIPGVRIELEQPMWIFPTKKTSIVFPSEVLIYHGGYRIPLRVGAVLAPISQHSFLYNQIPVEIRIIYAVPVPSKPVQLESLSPSYEIPNTILETVLDNQGIVVESNPFGDSQDISDIIANPPNVTVVKFPNAQASPTFQVSEEDDELVNRNPPQVLAPAGIVQSTQPDISVESFHNSKESPVLTELKQEKLKQKFRSEENVQQNNGTIINEESTERIKI